MPLTPIARRALTALTMLCGASLAPLAATAQTTITLDPCLDGLNGASSHTAEELGTFLQGSWRMVAAGTGFTTGTNVMSVSLRWDAVRETLVMEGQGQSVDLTAVQFDVAGDGSETDNAPFDMSIEALTPSALSAEDLAVLGVCDRPARYFWRLSVGGNSSWGGLMFYDGDAATGFMANSAGGSRHVVMER